MSILLNSISISWIIPVISGILFFVDSIIFAILEGTINLIFIVGGMNLGVLSGKVEYLVSNMKTLVGIFIIFKVSLLFIQYLIEPDLFKDKAKGGESFLKNMIVVVVLLTLLSGNLLFGIFNDIQKVIFNNGNPQYEVLNAFGIQENSGKVDMIQKVVFGNNNDLEPAHKLTVDIAQMFIYTCENGTAAANSCDKPIPWKDLPKGFYDDVSTILRTIHDTTGGASFFGLSTLDGARKVKTLQYIAVISSVFGIYMIMKFMKYGVSLVVRFFKLFVMQILAPIAIVSYAVPEGKKTFTNFWKTYFNIYFELFIRLFIVYVSVYMMDAFISNKNQILGGESSFDIVTLLILNIIIFSAISKIMDELPDLISGIFGNKLGDQKQKSMGAILGGLIGGGVGLGVGLGAAKAAGTTGFGALLSGGMGLFGGAKSGLNSQNIGSFVSGQVSNATKATGRGMDIAQAGGFGEYLRMQANKTFGGANAIKKEYDDKKETVDYYSQLATDREGVKNSGRIDYAKDLSKDTTRGSKYGNGQTDFKTLEDVVKYDSDLVFTDATNYFASGESGPFTVDIEGIGYEVRDANDLTKFRNEYETNRRKHHEGNADKATTELIRGNITDTDRTRKAETLAKIETGKLKAAEYNRKKTGRNVEFFDVPNLGSINFTAQKDKANRTASIATEDFRDFTEKQKNRNILGGGK